MITFKKFYFKKISKLDSKQFQLKNFIYKISFKKISFIKFHLKKGQNFIQKNSI